MTRSTAGGPCLLGWEGGAHSAPRGPRGKRRDLLVLGKETGLVIQAVGRPSPCETAFLSEERMSSLKDLLDASAARHSHLCPRQVLGVRIGLAGPARLELGAHCANKRLLVIAESDGCFVDGIEVATGCSVGHRTLRIEDYGKIAATFVDVKTGHAVRITPHLEARARARVYAPAERRHYFAQLEAYQVMPDDELLSIRTVRLAMPAEAIVSRAGVRINCAFCGEEIINEREVEVAGTTMCRACAGRAYYRPIEEALPLFVRLSETEVVDA